MSASHVPTAHTTIPPESIEIGGRRYPLAERAGYRWSVCELALAGWRDARLHDANTEAVDVDLAAIARGLPATTVEGASRDDVDAFGVAAAPVAFRPSGPMTWRLS